jgi:hypothetical protein
MFFVNLKGGLCNMMSQIAGTLAIAKKHNTDTSFLNVEQQLHYLNNETCFNPTINYCLDYKELNIFKNIKNNISLPYTLPIYEYPFHYEKIELTVTDAVLSGFFQSEKYFLGYENYIKHIFKPTDYITEYIQQQAPFIFQEKITSIHVRRGDYVRLSDHHPVQTSEYYQQAIEITKKDTDKYLIFSDDIEWCKHNFVGNKFIFAENNKDYIDMYLMSYCNNNITCNSTFSWWGAWLNNNPNKIVVGPQIWFGPALAHYRSDDIIPDKWIKL